jgi:hypothetical protein
MNAPIVGSEALATGSLTRGQLRWNYRSIFRDVYIPASMPRSLEVMTIGAWLLLWGNNHYPPGIIVRDERFQPDEVASIAGIAVAAPARAAFDLARHLPRSRAVAYLDALARATSVTTQDVMLLIERYPGAPGVVTLRNVLP